MNQKTRKIVKNVVLAVIVILIVCAVVAAVKGGEWRGTWDYLWGRINFLLLALAIYWWGWPFMMKMLDGRIASIGDEIGQFEKEKAEIEAEIKNIEDGLTQSADRFEQMKTKLEAEIKTKQEHIIANAKREAESIFEQAHNQRDFIFEEMRKGLKAELADMAVDNALAKLPEVITAKDQNHLFENFYNRAFSTPEAA